MRIVSLLRQRGATLIDGPCVEVGVNAYVFFSWRTMVMYFFVQSLNSKTICLYFCLSFWGLSISSSSAKRTLFTFRSALSRSLRVGTLPLIRLLQACSRKHRLELEPWEKQCKGDNQTALLYAGERSLLIVSSARRMP
jgi:hypothetical protein